jgi:ABC-type branched-subunit amino acid transport system ATPase component
MLDESSAGLSPVLVDRVLEVVQRLREAGTAVLLVESTPTWGPRSILYNPRCN